jgi:hypothetical protein
MGSSGKSDGMALADREDDAPRSNPIEPARRSRPFTAAGTRQVPLHRVAYLLAASPLIALASTFGLALAIEQFTNAAATSLWTAGVLFLNSLFAAVGCGAAGFLSHHDVVQRVKRTFVNLVFGFLSYWILLAVIATVFRL